MDKEIWENTVKFLNRTELKGNEVPAFIECIKKIEEQLKKKPTK